MKNQQSIRSVIKYSAISALALSSPLYAIERPVPAAQPEEKVAPQEKVAEQAKLKPIPMPEAPNVNAQEVAFLGVFGEPISDTLSAHLNLAEGVGIKLEHIAANSPAAKTGLKKHDIITSLAGKEITSMDDLRASIADKKPGDSVELKFISKGKTAVKDLVLGSRANLRARAGAGVDGQQAPPHQKLPAELGELGLPKEFLDKFPKKDREKLMKLFKGNLEGLELQEMQQGLGKLEGFDLNLLPKGLNPEMNKGLKFQGAFQSRIKMLDENGSITLESTKDGKVIELLDKEGKLQYRGPYNNEIDKKSIPEELRDRVANLGIENNLGLNLGKGLLGDLENRNKMNLKFKKLENFKGLEDIEKELLKQLPKEFKQQLKLPNFPNGKNLEGAKRFEFKFGKNSFSTSQTDPATGNRYTFKKEDKDKQVEVYDPQGKLLYDGPYNSDADKASVPNEYRDFIEKLDTDSLIKKGNRIELKLGE